MLSIAFLPALVACSSPTEERGGGAADPPTEQAMLQAGSACDLRRSGVAFTAPGCETCMQKKCCAPTIACFSGNPDCSALHTCLIACPADHPVLMPSGPEVDAETRREIENPCAAACEEAHAGSLDARTTYDGCIRSQCMPVCGS